MSWYALSDAERDLALRAVRAMPESQARTRLVDTLSPPLELELVSGYPDGDPPQPEPLSSEEEVELARLWVIFEEAGGRGVATAEAIDRLVAKRDGVYDPADYEQRQGLQCPYCSTIHWDGEEEGIRVIDVATRWHSFGFDAKQEAITGSYDNDGDYETNAYACETCDHEVALPPGITEEGW